MVVFFFCDNSYDINFEVIVYEAIEKMGSSENHI